MTKKPRGSGGSSYVIAAKCIQNLMLDKSATLQDSTQAEIDLLLVAVAKLLPRSIVEWLAVSNEITRGAIDPKALRSRFHCKVASKIKR